MKKLLIITIIISCLIVTGCVPQNAGNVVQNSTDAPKLRLAIQYGLGYAPITIAQELHLFEKYYPGLIVEWKEFGSGGAINEALIAGELDAAVMGIPPYLIAWDKGVDWKIAAGICVMPLSLQTYREDIKTLADFGPGDKIAYPAPGSIQHILLSMAAEKDLGNANALDDYGVAMAHPDAAAALLTKKDIVAHFTAPPYNFEELSDPSIHMVTDGTYAFGSEFSFLVAVATKEFHDNSPQAYAAFVMGLADAAAYINENPEEAAKILAPTFKLDEKKTLEYLQWEGMNYTITPYGLLGFGDFMKNAGYIKSAPKSLADIAWYNVISMVGEAQGQPAILEELQSRP